MQRTPRAQVIDLDKGSLFPALHPSKRARAPLTLSPSHLRTTQHLQYKEQRLRIKFAGGREVVGVLKSFDGLQNIVLDEAIEYLRDPSDSNTVTEATRYLGLLVVRGTATTILGPEDGLKSIANPFLDDEQEAEGAPQ